MCEFKEIQYINLHVFFPKWPVSHTLPTSWFPTTMNVTVPKCKHLDNIKLVLPTKERSVLWLIQTLSVRKSISWPSSRKRSNFISQTST